MGSGDAVEPADSTESTESTESTYRRRVQYDSPPLRVVDLAADPVEQWHRWHGEAIAAELVEPNAMTVATVGVDGVPDARIVLARAVSADGIHFFTNYESAKSRQLDEHPVAAAVFGWLDQHRQVRVRGRVERLSAAASDAYFATRPRGSQIGAWASPQSTPIDEGQLEARVSEIEAEFAESDVRRPYFWGGWSIRPEVWEFWQGRQSRLHDRFVYEPAPTSKPGWLIKRLAP